MSDLKPTCLTATWMDISSDLEKEAMKGYGVVTGMNVEWDMKDLLSRLEALDLTTFQIIQLYTSPETPSKSLQPSPPNTA